MGFRVAVVYGVVLAGIGAIVAATRRGSDEEPTDDTLPDARLLRTAPPGDEATVAPEASVDGDGDLRAGARGERHL